MTERIQKLLAAAGLCSRRTAEEWIAAGRVTVNGRRVHVGDKADPETDDIRVDGRPSLTNGAALRRHRWSGAAAHGCIPWDGWTWTRRDYCCLQTTGR